MGFVYHPYYRWEEAQKAFEQDFERCECERAGCDKPAYISHKYQVMLCAVHAIEWIEDSMDE